MKHVLHEKLTVFCFAFVMICMVFGGGPGRLDLSFAVIAFSGLMLLVAAVRGKTARAFHALPLIVRVSIAMAAALPFFQLIPLPPSIWHGLPGHGLRVAVLKAFDQGDVWMPLSITPAETAYSGVIALSMLGLFVGVLGLPINRVRMLLSVVIIMIAIGAVVGIIQVSTNGQAFQFYQVAHRDALIGFFANKNHMGLTLACLVPLSFVLLEHRLDSSRGAMLMLGIGWLALVAMLIETNSRAGLLLGLMAMLAASLRHFQQHRTKVILTALLTTAVALAVSRFIPAVRDIVDRFGQTGDDVRLNILNHGMPLVDQYGLLGSGLGSFASVYAPTEKLEWVNPFFLNHLHNDWLQLIIEAGIPGIVVLALMFCALGGAGRRLWFMRVPARGRHGMSADDGRSFAWAGFVIVLMFAAHSFGDYPVRRVGTLVLLIIALALIFRSCIDSHQAHRAEARSVING